MTTEKLKNSINSAYSTSASPDFYHLNIYLCTKYLQRKKISEIDMRRPGNNNYNKSIVARGAPVLLKPEVLHVIFINNSNNMLSQLDTAAVGSLSAPYQGIPYSQKFHNTKQSTLSIFDCGDTPHGLFVVKMMAHNNTQSGILAHQKILRIWPDSKTLIFQSLCTIYRNLTKLSF